ncbi:MAG: D-alanyl-D-alanine carboxypeptidase [Defluviitaleaceae bacterium]|nr:D-alanyl-D-alanine carboxypeptidase [Defluviitaleaceae bacterium]
MTNSKKMSALLALYLLMAQITSVYAEEIQMPPAPVYTAGAVILMDAATGLVLYEYEANTQMYPASITKVMTALVVLEHIHDLTERVEFCDYSIFSFNRLSSHISMDVGETLSLYEALHALMLESANEVSIALALHIAGGVDEFTDLMNRRAASLGATNTSFVNPSGLPARNHVTTAYDMALIMREAIRNPTFRDLISTVRFDIPPTERQLETRHLLNTNQQIRPSVFFNPYVVGGKTGWTTPAGNTLATYAANENRRLITIVLQGDGSRTYDDTTALLNFGFALPMESVAVFDSATYSLSVPVMQEIGGNTTEIGRVRLASDTDLSFELPMDWSNSWLRYELSVPETLTAPVYESTAVGRVAVYVQNIRVGEVPLFAQESVLAYTPPTYDPEATPATALYKYYHAEKTPFNIFTGRLAFLNNEYVLTLAVPLVLSLASLLFALVAVLTRNRRRIRRVLRDNRSKYSRYPHYRYK